MGLNKVSLNQRKARLRTSRGVTKMAKAQMKAENKTETRSRRASTPVKMRKMAIRNKNFNPSTTVKMFTQIFRRKIYTLR